MDQKTTGLLATGAAVFLCGCPGLLICMVGGIFALAPGMVEMTGLDGVTSYGAFPAWMGYAGLCAGILMLLVPVVVGFLMLRNRPNSL